MKRKTILIITIIVCSFFSAIYFSKSIAFAASDTVPVGTFNLDTMDELVCGLAAYIKNGTSLGSGYISKLKLDTTSYYINDNDSVLSDLTSTFDLKVFGTAKNCTATASGKNISVSWGNDNTSAKDSLDNIFTGYNSKNLQQNTMVPSRFSASYYGDNKYWYGEVKNCSNGSNENGGTKTKSGIRDGSGDGCHAYYILGGGHSLTTNSTSITLKINPRRFIGEDGHAYSTSEPSVSSTCSSGDSNTDCYSRYLYIYFCPTSSGNRDGYYFNKHLCHTENFTFKIYVRHAKLTASSTASPTSDSITSPTGSKEITFTHKYTNNNSNYTTSPTIKKVTQTVNGGTEIDITNSCTGSNDLECKVKVTAETAGTGEVHVDNGSSVKVCQKYYIEWAKTTYSKPSAKAKKVGVEVDTTTGKSNSSACSTISRTDPEVPTGGATFSTESSDANPQNWNDGASHDTTVTINHKINRTDTNANPSSVQTQYIIYESTTGRNGTYTKLADGNSDSFTSSYKSQSLSKTSSSITVPANQSITYCQKIIVKDSADLNGTLGSTWTSGTIGCAVLSNIPPSEETVNFSPSVSGLSLDSKLISNGSSGYTRKYIGDGSTTTYSVTFSESIKRENNSATKVSSASANYKTQCLNNGALQSCDSSLSLANNETKSVGGWNSTTINVTVPVGDTKTQCLELTASTSVKYNVYTDGTYAEVPNSRTKDTYKACVEIDNPVPRQTITFTGSSTATNLDSATSYWSAQGMYVGESTSYYVRLAHSIGRTSTESDLKKAIKAAPVRYKISSTTNGGSATTLVSPTQTTLDWNITTTPRSSMVSVPVNRGSSTTYCEKLEHDKEVYWENDKFEQSSPGYDSVHEACIKYGTPAYTTETENEYITFNINGSVGDPVSSANKVDGYYLLTSGNSSLTFPHKLERDDRGEKGSEADGTYTAYHKIGSGSFSAITQGNFALKGNQFTHSFNATSNGIAPSGLGTENAIDVCQKNNFVSKTYTITITSTFDVGYIDGIEYNRRFKGEETSPVAEGDGTTGESNTSCAKVIRPYNFRIDREDSDRLLRRTNPQEVVFGGQTSTITYSFHVKKQDNNYQLTGIPNATVKLFAFIFDADITEDIAEISAPIYGDKPDPRAFYTNLLNGNPAYNGKYTIEEVNTETTSFGDTIYSADKASFDGSYSYSYLLNTDLTPGQKYCTALAISPADSGSGLNSNSFNSNWVVSNFSCANVAKKPTMQVHGGSVFSKAGINTSKSSLPNSSDETKRDFFGSWGDFALISYGDINGNNAGMASGAALSEGKLGASLICTHSPLTIANSICNLSSNAITLGRANVSTSTTPEDFYSAFKRLFIADNTTTDSFSDSKVATSSGGHIDADVTTIYYSTSGASITIKDDLTVSNGSYNSVSDIPQILILSDGDVNIDEGVETIDAWIIAKGTVNTCSGFNPSDKNLAPSADDCNDELTINGPVVSNKLILPRTYGADPSNDTMSDPAELIDYLPSTILWAYNQSKNNNAPQTVYLKELAPRY